MSDKEKEASLGTLALLALLSVGVLGGLVWFASREKERAATEQAAVGAAAEKARQEQDAIRAALRNPEIKGTANWLSKNYESNPLNFEIMSKGKVGVVVSGTVNQIGREFGGDDLYITLGEGLVGGVRCAFDASRLDEVSALRKGQKLTVKGIVAGGAMGMVNLDHCEIAQ